MIDEQRKRELRLAARRARNFSVGPEGDIVTQEITGRCFLRAQGRMAKALALAGFGAWRPRWLNVRSQSNPFAYALILLVGKERTELVRGIDMDQLEKLNRFGASDVGDTLAEIIAFEMRHRYDGALPTELIGQDQGPLGVAGD